VDLEEMTSQRYWEKWDRVSEQTIETISRRFFSRIWEVEGPPADCLLFDTTNYYTYMESQTESDLAVRGKNKAGKHHLRQIGLGLLMARDLRLPLYYRTYPQAQIHLKKAVLLSKEWGYPHPSPGLGREWSFLNNRDRGILRSSVTLFGRRLQEKK
jgi:hypothetical protein